MDKDSESITKTDLTALANKIKQEFGVSNGYTCKKGKEYHNYTDKEKGDQLQILAFSESEAKQLINKVLNIKMFSELIPKPIPLPINCMNEGTFFFYFASQKAN